MRDQNTRVLEPFPSLFSVFVSPKKKKKKNKGVGSVRLGAVWYGCLKTENCYLKIFVEIRVGKRVY